MGLDVFKAIINQPTRDSHHMEVLHGLLQEGQVQQGGREKVQSDVRGLCPNY